LPSSARKASAHPRRDDHVQSIPFASPSPPSFHEQPRFEPVEVKGGWPGRPPGNVPLRLVIGQWDNDLTIQERLSIETEVARFRRRLSSPDRKVFDSKHRLSRVDRDAYLLDVGPQVAAERGWRFSDEPVDEPLEPEPEGAFVNHESTYRISAILMDAWDLPELHPMDLEVIVDGLQAGVNFGYNGPRDVARTPRNMASAMRHKQATLEALRKQQERGFLSRWFSQPMFSNLITHPVGVVPKDDGSWRLVENVSHPQGDSVNDWTDSMVLEYDSVDDFTRSFAERGKGAFLIVFDKESAFTSMPVRPEDRHLLGIFWPGEGYAYARVCKFGAKRSAGKWELVGTLWKHLVLSETSADNASKWVDDVATVVGASEVCEVALQIVNLARRYGYTLKHSKFVVAQRAKFLGIIYDSTTMSMEIPLGKRTKYLDKITNIMAHGGCSYKALQSLIGSLFHVAAVVRAARPYVARLLSVARACKQSRDSFNLAGPVVGDLELWVRILSNWAGSSIAAVRFAKGFDQEAISIFVDASPLGWGLWLPESGEWRRGSFSEAELEYCFAVKQHSSTALEALGLLHALDVLRDRLAGAPVRVFTDANNLVTGIASGMSSNPRVTCILHAIACCQTFLDTFLLVAHSSRSQPGGLAADALSKDDLPRLRRLAGHATLTKLSAPSSRSTPSWVFDEVPFAT
jgi:hypothetical protein